MNILGIETSCDETSVALIEAKKGLLKVRKNLVYSQIPIHQEFGGVVPEVAARHHVEKIIHLIKQILPTKLDAIVVTSGPGLSTALLVGVETARTLSYLLKVPLIATNHLEGHLYSNWLDLTKEPKNIFPALGLIVSGGHTELILIKDHLRYKLIGQTRDDAIGECFDKVGKILGLPYPAGPIVAKLSAQGNQKAIPFPRPMIDSKDFDFSFSGLKTAVLYYTQNLPKQTAINQQTVANICASFEQAAIDVILAKTMRAAVKYNVKSIFVGGGVSANQNLQKQLAVEIKKELPNIYYKKLNPKYCGDNAAMIAAAGYFHALKKDYMPWQKIKTNPDWELV